MRDRVKKKKRKKVSYYKLFLKILKFFYKEQINSVFKSKGIKRMISVYRPKRLRNGDKKVKLKLRIKKSSKYIYLSDYFEDQDDDSVSY